MSREIRLVIPAALFTLALAGCHSNNQTQPPATQAQTQPADDPASANLAPVSTDATDAQTPPPPPADNPQPSAQNQYAASDETGSANQTADTGYDVAPQPPPDLPDYDQPPAPADNYIWTPGYWSYAQQGYYWVPGAWVMPPYIGALWTPGYWGYDQGQYHWHRGYWGRHVGFYGGVNYGHGYDGNGYEGGYWRNNSFYYNRSVTRINETSIHNVYNYRVQDNRNNTRVSYLGGRGGLNSRPTAQQEAARRESHVGALPSQRQLAESSRQNRSQFAHDNHGRPQNPAESRPMNDGRQAPAPNQQQFHPTPEPRMVQNQPSAHYRMGPGPARLQPGTGSVQQPDRGQNRNPEQNRNQQDQQPRLHSGGGLHPRPMNPQAEPGNQQENRREQGNPQQPHPQPESRQRSNSGPQHESRPQNEGRSQNQERPQHQPGPPHEDHPQNRPEENHPH